MNLTALKSEVQTDPTGKGYAPLLPSSPGRVVDALNDKTTTMVKSRFVTARTILAECGAHGADILDALQAVAGTPGGTAVKWAVTFLSQDSGLDVGHPATQAMIDQLAAGNALTAEQASALKNLAVQPASRAEVLGLGVVTDADYTRAFFNDDGSPK